MYRVIKNQETIAIVESLRFIKLQDNGYYGEATEETAQGIVVNGTAYSLYVENPLEGLEQVVYQEVDSAEYIFKQQCTIDEMNTENEALMLVATELYEQNLVQEAENKALMLAVTELYENLMGGN